MCVIIVKNPGVELPFDMLSSACHVNPDGWGLSVADRGKAEVRRNYDPKGNNPEEIAKILEQSKELPVALHLRYATAGSKSLENCHPFDVLTPEEHGRHIVFMHNGTMSAFSPKDGSKLSDTANFNEVIVKRLIQDSVNRFGDAWYSEDEFTQRILKEFAGTYNKLVLFDDQGNSMIINKDQGKKYEGFWASNEYSFNRQHREPTRSHSYYNHGTYRNYDNDDYEWDDATRSFVYVGNKPKKDKKTETKPTITVPTISKKADTSRKKPIPATDYPFELNEKETEELSAQLKEDLKNSPWGFDDGTYRQTFTDLTGVSDLSELCRLTETDIHDIVVMYPEVSTILIMDLLYELYLTNETE